MITRKPAGAITRVTSTELFDPAFTSLTGHQPFPWQRSLFEEFLALRFPDSCDIPTGLGKTSIIAIWLIALSAKAQAGTASEFPRRLVYVVNRRTVVDQATDEAVSMRERLRTPQEDLRFVAGGLAKLSARSNDSPLAISTLRGEFADNAEWRDDPARSAVIVGTVDMIGSRLLFGGYGCGFKSRPLHAAFLGQDVLLVHDEAHLEPAFQALIATIQKVQQECGEYRRFRVMELTATSRTSAETFHLGEADLRHDVVRRRMNAGKGIVFHPVENDKQTAGAVVDLAIRHEKGSQAVLVFLRRVEDVEAVAARLRDAQHHVRTLTGTMRGLERDALAKDDSIFARFQPHPGRAVQTGTVYLVCTSAGEVGVNISADHLICDLTPFDSMAQRFGRVNRWGSGDARIEIVHVDTLASDTHDGEADESSGARQPTGLQRDFDIRVQRTLALLQQLPVRNDGLRDASPSALANLPAAARRAAFTPEPRIPIATDVLLDRWALTSIRGKMPGRPAVTDWLHGEAEWEPPQTTVAWRAEVDILRSEALRELHEPSDLLEEYPLKAHETLRDRSDRVFKHLQKIAARAGDLPVWVVFPESSEPSVTTLADLVGEGQESVVSATVLLPPRAGGLAFSRQGNCLGVLDGTADFEGTEEDGYDIADRWLNQAGQRRRCRTWDASRPPGMRLVRTIKISAEVNVEADEDESPQSSWRWYVTPRSADDDGSRTAREAQLLADHLDRAEHYARRFAETLGLTDPEASALAMAARWHDLGKRRRIWQVSVRNTDYPRRVLAKSAGSMDPLYLTGFRHEFGSILDVAILPDFLAAPADVQQLVLHVIAAHHGRARPHFIADEAFDPERAADLAQTMAREVPRRFGRLQRKYGRWGLAYLESLVRAADALASQPDDAIDYDAVAIARVGEDRR